MWATGVRPGQEKVVGALPLFHVFGMTGGHERRHRRRLRDHPVAALPPRPAPEGDPPGAGDGDAGRADHVLGDQRLAAARAVRPLEPALLHLGRRAAARAVQDDLRAPDRLRAGRGLRPHRGGPGLHAQPVRRRAPAGLGRPAAARHAGRDRLARRAGPPAAARPAGRDLHQRAAAHGGLRGARPRRPRRRCAMAACTPAMSATSTRTATST